MSLHFRKLLPAVSTLLFLLAPDCQAAPPQPGQRQIAVWIEQLGDNDFQVREEASRKLWEAGSLAEAALEKAAQSDDAEVAHRARAVLGKLNWGITPSTPPAILKLIQNYRGATDGDRAEHFAKLLQAGPEGRAAAIQIAVSGDESRGPQLREVLFKEIMQASLEQVSSGRLDRLEELLTFGPGEAASLPHYVAWCTLRGKLEEAVAHYEELVRQGSLKRRWRVLAHLYRAKGDLAAACTAARKVDDPTLIDGMLYEAGDWKALAAASSWSLADGAGEKLAFAATFARLAGDRKVYERQMEELRRLTQGQTGERLPGEYLARVLFLNDRPEEALALLGQKDDGSSVFPFEILSASFRFREALALANGHENKERIDLQLLKARTLYRLGEQEAGLAQLRRLAGIILEPSGQATARWYPGLLQAEVQAGLMDLALTHCARMLTGEQGQAGPASMAHNLYLTQLFPEHEKNAAVLWALVRELYPSESMHRSLERLRGLLEGKGSADDLKKLLAQVEAETKAMPEVVRMDRFKVVGEAAWAAGQEALARSCLEKAPSAQTMLLLGDWQAEKKKWREAAEHYRQAWKLQRSDPLPLLLAGRALAEAGQHAEGQRLCEQAHWLPLGDVASRYRLLRALLQRRLRPDADRETTLMLAVSEPASYHSGAALRHRGLAASARKDHLQSARDHEVALLRCLHSGTTFVQASAYLAVPALVHRERALGLLSGGKVEEGLAEAARAQQIHPANVDLPIALAPELEKCGRKKEADRLFTESRDLYEKVCREYPRFAHAHNSLAWMCACCRRDLDRGLVHARRAVELEPRNAGYIDTLAEIQLQSGAVKEAIAAQERAIALDPHKPYFRKQLARIRAGDPAAPRPDEEDE